MSKKVEFIKAKKLRRISAGVIDLIIAVILSFLLYMIVEPIINSTSYYKDNMSKYNQICVNSGLFYLTSDNEVHLISENIDSKLITFLTTYSTDGLDYYNNLKIESGLFDSNYIVLDTVLSKDVESFYTNTLSTIVNGDYFENYVQNNYDYAISVVNSINFCNTLKIIISFVIGTFGYYLLMPLFIIDRRTLGKMVFRLKILYKKTGKTPSYMQILVSKLIFILIEILLSLYTTVFIYVPVVLVISFVLMFISNGSQSLHDYMCSLIIVDDEGVKPNTKESEKLILEVEDN